MDGLEPLPSSPADEENSHAEAELGPSQTSLLTDEPHAVPRAIPAVHYSSAIAGPGPSSSMHREWDADVYGDDETIRGSEVEGPKKVRGNTPVRRGTIVSLHPYMWDFL